MKIDDETARDIFNTYSTFIFQTAFFLTGSQSLAEDIAQDSLIKIFRSYDSYNSKKPMKPWIYKIVQNTVRTTLKQESDKKTVPLQREIVSKDIDAITKLLTEERYIQLLRAMDQISLNSKEVIVLRFFEGMSLKEIAETLSVPVGTCKSRLNTAIKQLRRNLPEEIVALYERGENFEES